MNKRNETDVAENVKVLYCEPKKYVRYKEGAQRYSLGLHTFETLAKEAGAVYKIKKIALVNTEVFEEFLENFREQSTL